MKYDGIVDMRFIKLNWYEKTAVFFVPSLLKRLEKMRQERISLQLEINEKALEDLNAKKARE